MDCTSEGNKMLFNLFFLSVMLLYVFQIKQLQTSAVQTTNTIKEELVECLPRIIDVPGKIACASHK